MSVQALIRQAQVTGVALRLLGGKVKTSGPREAVARLLVQLRELRAALADAMQADQVETVLEAWPNAAPQPADWQALDPTYLAHHFNRLTCIAAGGGSRYVCAAEPGVRCGSRILIRLHQHLITGCNSRTQQIYAVSEGGIG